MSCNGFRKIIFLFLFLFFFSGEAYGQISEIESNGNQITAQVVNLPAIIQGNAGSTSDDKELTITTSVSDKQVPVNDLFKITLIKKTYLDVLLKILDQTADIELIIINNKMENVVASSARVFSESEFIFKELEASSYFIGIVSSSGITDYVLDIKEAQINDKKPHTQEIEPNSLNAQEITLPLTVEGVLDKNDFTAGSVNFNGLKSIKDLYVFNLTDQRIVTIDLKETASSLSDYGVVLFDSFKRPIEASSDQINKGLNSGLYFVGVFLISGERGRYSLSIEDILPVSKTGLKTDNEPNDTPELAQLVTLPAVISGTASVNDPVGTKVTFDNSDSVIFSDFYKFVLLESSKLEANLKINANTKDADLELVLFDKTGLRVLELSDNSGSEDEKILKILEPGLYYISVGAFSSSASYTLSIKTSDLAVDEILTTDTNALQINITGDETLLLLPGLKEHKTSILVNAVNFLSKSKCKIGDIVGSNIKVRPKQFFLTPKRTNQPVKLIVSRSHAEELINQNLVEAITVSALCENGANASKEIIIKPAP